MNDMRPHSRRHAALHLIIGHGRDHSVAPSTHGITPKRPTGVTSAAALPAGANRAAQGEEPRFRDGDQFIHWMPVH